MKILGFKKAGRVRSGFGVITKILAFLILLLSLNVNLCQAAIVWSDNFDDGNLEGWKISGASYAGRTVETLVVAAGNCSVAEKTLCETSEPKMSGYTYLAHPIGVNKGTWSFDAYFSEEGTFNGIPVIFNLCDKDEVTKADWMLWHGYEIRASEAGSLGMSRMDRASGNPFLYNRDYYQSFNPTVNSWLHFDITYDGEGRFMVYVDNELCLDQTDTGVTNFEYVGFWLQSGAELDNIVVNDEIFVPSASVKLTTSLKVTVKDSSGNALSGAMVSSSKQPSGQNVLSGLTEADGTITFTDLAVGDYTLQVSKSGYLSGSTQGKISSGTKTEVSTTLQIQTTTPTQTTSGGIPGFPIFSVILGIMLCVLWLWRVRT